MRLFLPAFLLMLSPLGGAANFDTLDALNQQEFRALAGDLGAAFGYKAVQTAEPFGTIGYDLAVGASSTRFSHAALWRRAGNNSGSSLTLARVGVTKGLTDRFDLGGYFATANSGLRVYGLQGRFALLEGGVSRPALGVRAAMTRVDGAQRLDFDTRSVDVMASQRFGPLTPYVGVGRQWVDARPAADTGLQAESFANTRTFAGLRFTSLVMQAGIQVERIADANGYSANIGFYF